VSTYKKAWLWSYIDFLSNASKGLFHLRQKYCVVPNISIICLNGSAPILEICAIRMTRGCICPKLRHTRRRSKRVAPELDGCSGFVDRTRVIASPQKPGQPKVGGWTWEAKTFDTMLGPGSATGKMCSSLHNFFSSGEGSKCYMIGGHFELSDLIYFVSIRKILEERKDVLHGDCSSLKIIFIELHFHPAVLIVTLNR
jgi:hypothetical protein